MDTCSRTVGGSTVGSGPPEVALHTIALKTAANGIVISDRKGTILFANPAFTSITGFSVQEVVGQNPRFLKSGQHDAAFYENLWRTIMGGQVWQGEVINRRKDGTLYQEEMTITPVRAEGGDITHFIAVKQDVTRRHQAEEALKMSEQRWRILFEYGPDAFYLHTLEGTFVDGNRVAEELIGYRKKEIVGKNLLELDLLDANGKARAAVLMEKNRRGLAGGAEEFTITCKGGRKAIIEISSYPVQLQDTVLVLGVARDITQRKQAESALQHANQFTEDLLKTANVFFLQLDREGNIVRLNSAAEEISGYKSEELVGKSWFQTLAPKDRYPQAWEEFQRLLTGQIPKTFENSILTKGGEERHILWKNNVVRADGKVLGTISFGMDITERKELEAQLRQSQKLEAIGQLAGGVAHDFNNLLAVIRGNSELLMLEPEGLSAQTKESLQQITASADRAGNLTRQLLAFSRKQVMQSRPLDVNELLRNLLKLLTRLIREDIELHCNCSAKLPRVQADPGMIEQVVVNLVVNARDAMPGGGKLYLRTERVVIDEAAARRMPDARPGEFVCLSVCDTGTGIAPEHLPHIFEPFFTTKEVGKGSGLGLATVYGILKQHQGWVQVVSQPGAGATFRVFLPAIAAPAVPMDPRADETNRSALRGHETILLVEDDASVRLTLRQVLLMKGYRVIEAGSAAEAVELFNKHSAEISLLLSDMVMPQGVTGRDLALQLRSQQPALKVVFMSGYVSDLAGKDTEFFRRHKSFFLQKPCSAVNLLRTVRQCLDNP